MSPLQQPILENLVNQSIAFISVFDKTGLADFARVLVEQYNTVIISTGGTRKYLAEHQIDSIESAEITGFEELLGGRVKSLHPHIFAGILAETTDRENIVREKNDLNLPFTIDIVVANLYPFEAERDALKEKNACTSENFDHLLHFIDIGGSALLRAAAKNYPAVSVLSNCRQYSSFLEELSNTEGTPSLAFKKRLAYSAFSLTAYYDGLIAQAFADESTAFLQQTKSTDGPLKQNMGLPDLMGLPLAKIEDLRYGENPHQKAALYGVATQLPDYKCMHGKALSFNNILDMQAAWQIVVEFSESYACAIVKHNNPCGVALSETSVDDAFQRALDTDPVSAFGGVVAFNDIVSKAAAKIMHSLFLEVIIAPGFEEDAFDLLSSKKNIRLVTRELPKPSSQVPLEFKHVSETLMLVQTVDIEKRREQEKKFAIATQEKPNPDQMEDIAFAWKVVKHCKSNAIVLAKNKKTVGIGAGNTSRIGALENALKLACDQSKGAVLASDGFLPHEDNVYAAAQARVGVIVQPGGSIKDGAVISLANENKIAMITTGIREFKH
ncbi:MAG: bifunctional phosphoribosylaminoimidazolecarboxamide formyltransferase/IMP cyclohydrolase [Cyanobacteria bacterium P01_H01_bin.74]